MVATTLTSSDTDPMNASSEPLAAPTAERWTRVHILLHWAVAGLIVVQFVTGQWMTALFQERTEGITSDAGPLSGFAGPMHMAVGLTVFLAIAARLWDRTSNGRPAHPPGEPKWAQRLAALTQTLLYATVLAMPIAGLVAWFTENAWLASTHALAAKALVALVALHAAGALANHYWFKTDVLRKMLPGQGRDAHRETRPGVAKP